MQTEDLVVVGKFGRTHGVKGVITVISSTQPRDNILNYKPWYARVKQVWEPLNIIKLELNHKHILAEIEGYHSCEAVGALTNLEIAVKREVLPKLKPGEFYWHQLIGMTVVNLQQMVLGTVDEIMPTGSNDVLIVSGEKRHLIPYLMDTVILSIDDEQKRITVDWDSDF